MSVIDECSQGVDNVAAVIDMRRQCVLAVLTSSQGEVDLCGGAGFAQGDGCFLDESSLLGCGEGEFVFLGTDAFFEGSDLFVAWPGVAFGPFGRAVEGVNP